MPVDHPGVADDRRAVRVEHGHFIEPVIAFVEIIAVNNAPVPKYATPMNPQPSTAGCPSIAIFATCGIKRINIDVAIIAD